MAWSFSFMACQLLLGRLKSVFLFLQAIIWFRVTNDNYYFNPFPLIGTLVSQSSFILTLKTFHYFAYPKLKKG